MIRPNALKYRQTRKLFPKYVVYPTWAPIVAHPMLDGDLVHTHVRAGVDRGGWKRKTEIKVSTRIYPAQPAIGKYPGLPCKCRTCKWCNKWLIVLVLLHEFDGNWGEQEVPMID